MTGLGLNNAGQVTGYSYTPTGSIHAFLYSNGQMQDLGTLPGYSGSSRGYAINDAGQVGGASYMSTSAVGQGCAFLYSDGQMQDLGTLGGAYSDGRGINNAGQVKGEARTSTGETHAFLYSSGQMIDLGTLGGIGSASGYGGSGYDINDAGQVVGSSYTPTGMSHAFLYSNGQMRDLNDLVDPRLGITLLAARAINDNGQIVADRYLLSSNGQITDLGTLGGSGSGGSDINNAGQVVGSSLTSTGFQRAFLYSNGQMSDLNDLIDPTLGITSGNASAQATAINDRGQIVVNSNGVVGEYRTYLLTPVPEPSTLALFGAALLGLAAWACHHPNVFR